MGYEYPSGQFQPPAVPAPGAQSRRTRPLLVAVVAIVLAAAVAGIIAAVALGHKQAPASSGIAAVLPSSTGIYVSADLRPTGQQAAYLNSLLPKFSPGLSLATLQRDLDSGIDMAGAGLGVTHSDVDSWFTGQIALALPAADLINLADLGNGSAPPLTLVLGSSNDTAAAALQAKLMKLAHGATTTTYDGVSVESVTANGVTLVTAITGGNVFVTDNLSLMHTDLDTATGRAASLASDGNYTATMGQLPSSPLVEFYMSQTALGNAITSAAAAASSSSSSKQLQKVKQELLALRGVGVTAEATAHGFEANMSYSFEPGKLSSSQAQAAAAQQSTAALLQVVPGSALGFLSTPAAKVMVQSLNSISSLSRYHPATLAGLMRGPAAVELFGPASSPNGVLIVPTNNSAGMSSYLTELAQTACAGCTAQTTAHDGVTINSVPVQGSMAADGFQGSGVAAWTVYNGSAYVGSSVSAVETAMDVNSADSMAHSSAYQAAAAVNSGPTVLTVYGDLGSVPGAAPVTGFIGRAWYAGSAERMQFDLLVG